MNMSVYSYMANNKKKWRAVYRYTDFTGKRRQTQKRGFNTKREAEFWLENKKKAENGQLNMTFGSFYEIYERDKKARVKETTFETKSYVVRDKILPYFKDRRMDEIKPKDVMEWQNELLNYRNEKGEPYSSGYLRTIHAQLSAIFNFAKRYYGLSTNPAAIVGTMKNDVEKEVEIWTKEAKYLGNVLSCLTGQGLSLDKIYLYGTDELPKEDVSIFKTAGEAIKRFLWSFTDEADSDNYAASDQNEEELEVWVAQSTVTVQILQQLLDETYNKEHNTNIRLKVMPNEQKLVLSNATNTNPDVVLCATAGQPFTFACRGALKNLLDYEDFMDVYTKDYQLESLVATSYGDGVYGAVDSRNFQLLFYRKDILESLHLEVPQTWDDLEAMMPTLLRNQMNCYIPISQRASLKGLGVTTPFIYQKGAEIYSEKGNTTAINSTESVDAITEMTEFYKIYGMQTTVENFYLSFRYGEVPIGIGDFNTYLQLKMAAPELAGQWGVALCPGTRQKDGSILRYQPADTTASMIFANTDKPDEAWEFLKWWLDEDTQYEYSIRRCQSLGLEYQWNTANIEAFKKLPFDSDVKEKAIEQWQYQREVTPHPASYIVERELSGVWNDVVIDSSDMMESLDQAVLVIDREIKRKLQEFGYIDQDGKLIKDYNIEILKMLYTKTGRRGAKNEK